jgi:hypothetical protein
MGENLTLKKRLQVVKALKSLMGKSERLMVRMEKWTFIKPSYVRGKFEEAENRIYTNFFSSLM